MKPAHPRRTPTQAPAAPGDALRRARREAAAAEAAVAAGSQVRLSELLRANASARLAALEDPELLPADRATLRRSLQAELRGTIRRQLVSPEWLGRIGVRLPRWRGAFVWLSIAGLGLALFLGVATSCNGEPALLTTRITVALVEPDGNWRQVDFAPSWMVVRRLNATQAQARWWIPGSGYQTAVIPLAVLWFPY